MFSGSNIVVAMKDSSRIPIGVVVPFAGDVIPDGWLLCDGSAINREMYSQLFDVIGTLWGCGDYHSTFNIPDLRENVPVGIDSNSTHPIASHDVYSLGQFKDDQMEKQSHCIVWRMEYYLAISVQGPGSSDGFGLKYERHQCDLENTYSSNNTSDNYGRKGNVTRGKRIGVNYIIKYFNVY